MFAGPLSVRVLRVPIPLERLDPLGPRLEALRGGLRLANIFLVHLLIVASVEELVLDYLFLVALHQRKLPLFLLYPLVQLAQRVYRCVRVL